MKASAQSAICVGAAVTAVIALLPYIRDFFIIACLAGALAAVWFAVRKRQQSLSFTEGAQLGFLSGFYGLLATTTIYDLIWRAFHYKLWRIQNADRMIALFSGMLRDAVDPSVWFFVTLQIVTVVICARAFAAPSGILGAKIFQPW